MNSEIATLHTLGPEGTNCERAAYEWFNQSGREGEVILYSTLEEAAEAIPASSAHALMGCIVYPSLSSLVFNNLGNLLLVDCLIMPTDEMVYAANANDSGSSVAASHQAPKSLLPDNVSVLDASSNPIAAKLCSQGKAGSCITNKYAADKYKLTIIRSFGEVMMGFSVHQKIA